MTFVRATTDTTALPTVNKEKKKEGERQKKKKNQTKSDTREEERKTHTRLFRCLFSLVSPRTLLDWSLVCSQLRRRRIVPKR
jgi:hypothetical protein